MALEFLNGRPLDPDELDEIRRQVEAFDFIEVISPEVRDIVKRNWPHLISKMSTDEDDNF